MNSAITGHRVQIPKAMWSHATIHSRLRRAILLLPASQAAVSSGFQSVMRRLRAMRYSPFVDGGWGGRGGAAASGGDHVARISRTFTPVDPMVKLFGRVGKTGWCQLPARSEPTVNWCACDPPRP